MHASTVAIDLAKEVFELAFADAQGRIIERKRLSRRAFIRSLETRPPLRVLMEACGGAHCWARRFQRQGHAVRLLPARDVRPYVRGNKTDRNDVAGILEADRCAGIAPVPVKTPEQQGIQALHRLREHLKAERTATLNLLRGVLREFGEHSAADLAEAGFATGASTRNWAAYGAEVTLPDGLPLWQRALLTDPQTSGGLLVACAPDTAEEVLARIRAAGFPLAAIVGHAEQGPAGIVVE